MIQYLGKKNFKHKCFELGWKGRKRGREQREGEGVPNSRCTTGEGSFTPSLLA
jgi:hypothetical protein